MFFHKQLAVAPQKGPGGYCQRPFKWLTLQDGFYQPCCGADSNYKIGHSSLDPLDVWLGRRAEALRQDVLSGAYENCQFCREYLLHKDKWFKSSGPNWDYEAGPTHIALNYDHSCNLSCPQCRTGKVVMPPEDREKWRKILRRLSEVYFHDQLQWLITSGRGEPFMSPTTMQLFRSMNIRDYPNLSLQFYTNGLLFKQGWEKMGDIRQATKIVGVSVDGGTGKTYETNRRGGKWKRLLENLEFIGDLKSRGSIKEFNIICVVQENNFREINQLYRIANRYGASKLMLKQLEWGADAYMPDYYDRAVTNEKHPHFEDFRKQLRSLRKLSKEMGTVKLAAGSILVQREDPKWWDRKKKQVEKIEAKAEASAQETVEVKPEVAPAEVKPTEGAT